MIVVVVGAGVHGLATARALARRGRSVRVLERFRLGHARGSSHGVSRVFRLSYPEEHYVRLAQEALPRWRELEQEVDEELLLPTATLDVGAYAADNEAALAACDVEFERLTAAEVARRFGVTVAGEALYQPDGAILRADRCTAALASGAREAGAEVREDAAVTGLEPEADGVRLETTAGPLQADAVVVTAGAWAPGLLATAGIELDAVPTRETVVYVRPERDDSPPATVITETEPGRVIYALPAPGIGIKGGIHGIGPVIDPGEEGAPSSETADEVEAWIRSVYGECTRVRVETCLYTNRPEERFALERHGRVVVGSACSGHGFKFAPVVGERLADLVEEVHA